VLPPSFSIVQTGAPVLRQRARELRSEEIGLRIPGARRQDGGYDAGRPWRRARRSADRVGLRVIVLEDRPELEAKSTPLELEERERAPFPLRVIVNPELRPSVTPRRCSSKGA